MAVPSWIQSAVFYQIFPDRFANGDHANDPVNVHAWGGRPTNQSFFGGDFKGIEENLEYLAELGINAVYLNPIFLSPSTHRYNTVDYFQVDDKLGDLRAFRSLIRECHKRNIKVILDGVFNHCGRGFFAFSDVLENGALSSYKDWFYIRKFPLDAYSPGDANDYEGWWRHKSLPKLNTSNPNVRKYIYRVAEYWLSEGADGWRLDVPNEIDDDGFWLEFRKIVKAANPEAYIVGEIWDINSRWVGDSHFDGLMNYPLRSAVIEFLTKKISNMEFLYGINNILDAYPQENNSAMLNILSSHDVERIFTILKKNIDKVKQAVFLQMTAIGCPCIYYGDEIGMEGDKDPDCRRTFSWDQSKWDHRLLEWTKNMINLRMQHAALTLGDYRPIAIPAYPDLFVFERNYKNEKLIGLLNNSDTDVLLPIHVLQQSISPSESVLDLISKTDYTDHKELNLLSSQVMLLRQTVV